MRILIQILFVVMNLAIPLYGQNSKIGIFQTAADVGAPANSGRSSYDPAAQEYIIKGGGYNIWFNRDEFHYLYNSIKGDFILTANFEFIGDGIDAHRKVGWMIRESMDEEAPISAQHCTETD
ncbi:MAG: hypothetical protein MI975_20605 [Cytophagales bacterium]|nr:hypothetical protein [Cytophagales bacterium]